MKLPHQVYGWSESEYVLWLQKHQDGKEHWALLEKAVDDQVERGMEDPGLADGKGEEVFVRLIREVLEHARHEDQSPGVG